MKSLIPIYMITIIAILSGCNRDTAKQTNENHEWIIDKRYWYVETQDGLHAHLVSKDGAHAIEMSGNAEVQYPELNMSKMIVKGSFTVIYDDGESIFWDNGDINSKPNNGKWIIIK